MLSGSCVKGYKKQEQHKRSDQFSRRWRILRHVEDSKHGLTAAEIAELSAVSLKTGNLYLKISSWPGFPCTLNRGNPDGAGNSSIRIVSVCPSLHTHRSAII